MKGISYKERVRQIYCLAYSAKDVDGYVWVWSPGTRGALNGTMPPTKGTARAWRLAYQYIFMVHEKQPAPQS